MGRFALLAATGAAVVALAAATSAGAVTGDTYVADLDNMDGNGGVLRVNTGSHTRSTISRNNGPSGLPEFRVPMGIAVEPEGSLLVSHRWNLIPGGGAELHAGIARIAPTGIRSVLSMTTSREAFPFGGPDFDNPYGVALDLGGELLVADLGLGAIVRVDSDTGARALVTGAGRGGGTSIRSLVDVDVLPDGDIVALERGNYCATSGATRECGAVIRVDPSTGSRSIISANQPRFNPQPRFDAPNGLAVRPDGDVVVANTGNANVLKVDTATGTRTIAADTSSPGAAVFRAPNDLVVIGGPADTTYVTDDGGTPQVLLFDDSGRTAVLSSNTSPVGSHQHDFRSPWGIDFKPTALAARARSSGTRAGFAYTLDERATIAVTIWRRAGARWKRAGAFRAQGAAGANAASIPAAILRTLRPGGHRATLLATNRRGVRSRMIEVTFDLARRSGRGPAR
jgi:hypothetical protein